MKVQKLFLRLVKKGGHVNGGTKFGREWVY